MRLIVRLGHFENRRVLAPMFHIATCDLGQGFLHLAIDFAFVGDFCLMRLSWQRLLTILHVFGLLCHVGVADLSLSWLILFSGF